MYEKSNLKMGEMLRCVGEKKRWCVGVKLGKINSLFYFGNSVSSILPYVFQSTKPYQTQGKWEIQFPVSETNRALATYLLHLGVPADVLQEL